MNKASDFYSDSYTNYDKIKAMSIEQLAEFIQDMGYCKKCAYCGGMDEDDNYLCNAPHNDLMNNDCITGCIKWLKRESD